MKKISVGDKVIRKYRIHNGMVCGDVDIVTCVGVMFGRNIVTLGLDRFGEGHNAESFLVLEDEQKDPEMRDKDLIIAWANGAKIQGRTVKGRWWNVGEMGVSYVKWNNPKYEFRLAPPHTPGEIQAVREKLEALTAKLKEMES